MAMTSDPHFSISDAFESVGVDQATARKAAEDMLNYQRELSATRADLETLETRLSARIDGLRRQIWFVGGAAGLAAVSGLATVAELFARLTG